MTIACRLSAIATSLENAFAASILLWCFPTINLNNADESECRAGNKSRQSLHSAIIDKHQHMHFTFNTILV